MTLARFVLKILVIFGLGLAVFGFIFCSFALSLIIVCAFGLYMGIIYSAGQFFQSLRVFDCCLPSLLFLLRCSSSEADSVVLNFVL